MDTQERWGKTGAFVERKDGDRGRGPKQGEKRQGKDRIINNAIGRQEQNPQDAEPY